MSARAVEASPATCKSSSIPVRAATEEPVMPGAATWGLGTAGRLSWGVLPAGFTPAGCPILGFMGRLLLTNSSCSAGMPEGERPEYFDPSSPANRADQHLRLSSPLLLSRGASTSVMNIY